MKQKLFIAILFVTLSLPKGVLSQNVGIGTTTPHASAVLDISSTTKGLLLPRMTTAQRNAIVSPAVGLMILNLDDKCADVYNGTEWIKNCGFTLTFATIPGGVWTQKTDFGGTARYNVVGFSIGNKGYIGTGFDVSNKKDFWEYDAVANTWTQKADFGGTGRRDAVGFSIGSKGYIGTGFDPTYKKDFWEYDPSTNAWTQKTDFGGTAMHYAVGFSIASKGYIGTGYDGSLRKDFWEYDPGTNAWTQKADFGGTARSRVVGFSIGSKGYIGTGFDGIVNKNFWEYDPGTNAWTQKADFGGTARYAAVGFSIGSKGYIGTGLDGTVRKDFWEYDPGANAWTQKTDFGGTARRDAVGFSIGNKGYIGTGLDGTVRKDFWEYNPDSIGSYYTNNISNYYQVNGGLWVKTVDTLKNATGISTILITGNVGIGTNTPSQKLHVIGNVTISGNTGIGTNTPSQKLHVIGNATISGNTGIGTISPSQKLDVVGNATISGDVGIGTTNPGAKLSLGTSYPNQRLLSFFDAYATNNGFGVGIEDNAVAGGSRLIIYCSELSPTNGVAFGSYTGTTFTERMRVQADGNVGIGTLTPLQKLDVTGNTNITGKIFVSDSALLNGNAKVSGNAIINGNTGIGTTTPSQKLDVTGNANITGKIFVSDSALLNGNTKILGNAIINGNTGIGNTTPSQKLDVTGNANITGKIIVSDSALLNGNAKILGNAIINGNTGIGTSSPSAKLHVAGNQKIDGTNTLEFGAGVAGKDANAGKIGYQTFTVDALDIVGAGTLGTNRKIHFFNEGGAIFDGSVYAPAFIVTSDSRFKTKINPLQSPIRNLMLLQGVSYYFNLQKFGDRGFSGQKQYGFLAQQVESVMPEIVHTGSDGYKSVNYMQLIPLLTESIKEQQRQLDEQRKINQSLQQQINELKKLIDKK